MGLVAVTKGCEKDSPFIGFCNGLRGSLNYWHFERCSEMSPKVGRLPVVIPSSLKRIRGRKSLYSWKRHNMVTRSYSACILS